jgi:hypothetical protein
MASTEPDHIFDSLLGASTPADARFARGPRGAPGMGAVLEVKVLS